MTKLIFINRFFYPDISATSQLLSDLVFSLTEEGHEVEVVCSRLLYTDATADALPLKETINGARVSRMRSTSLGKEKALFRLLDYLTFYVCACWHLLFALKAGSTIITKTDPPLLSIPVGFIAKLKGADMVNWYQDVFPEVAQAAGMRFGNNWTTTKLIDAVKWLRNKSLRSSTATVVLSESMRTRLIECAIPDHTLHVIPNWSSTTDINAITSEDSCFREIWQLQDQFIVGYSGNLGIAHEFDTLVGAADLLRNEKRITFLIVGSGQRRQGAMHAVNQKKLEDKVLFKPYQPKESLGESLGVANVHLISLLPEMEGLIVPSKFYGIAAAARPTIYIGDTSSEMAQMLETAKCGCSIETYDSAALANQIMKYFKNKEHCIQQGNNALALSDKSLTPTQAKAAWKSLLLQPN